MKNIKITFPIVILAMLFSFPNFVNAQENETKVFTIVENMPTFQGCEGLGSEDAKQNCTTEKIIEFISENIIYPEEAKAQGIEGRVFLSYIVKEDGKVADIQVLRGVPNGKLLDEEAIRVV